jgi:hypothetical protein
LVCPSADSALHQTHFLNFTLPTPLITTSTVGFCIT